MAADDGRLAPLVRSSTSLALQRIALRVRYFNGAQEFDAKESARIARREQMTLIELDNRGH